MSGLLKMRTVFLQNDLGQPFKITLKDGTVYIGFPEIIGGSMRVSLTADSTFRLKMNGQTIQLKYSEVDKYEMITKQGRRQ
ncbi:MAG: hypothetical protein A2268_00940 [Candidatus Raymondbacteria bacterium RifOxyA12_full_50_37]|uniref:Uncharacterized protein n=1 Tax=Candidatus Raymondbacteria bacterium RIFOXYD12_FULL_49_13 TaxID=1817890 RepID=A0A1F7FFL0_UNCRA|nr:MAG: hypothetical protein A2268_00940 [Candidatus Raymondbacteria bacterium RifOxyA12_full_50_37]OGJ86369.1 MAG: hypothetical protein A2248_13905 [Candidatus Raymondbacteria bacterium RIFOXYA2_FULL_49_16]OGJ95539.1 MAG: hypothetical protein A2453_12680 [Candidatus Raymondbacteria bacterium RIFOXYC2_FULL_50_21]OGJ96100.1 MAG: hypothetical protein A2487_01705 [Candidatus Raymondbacteria bacterium RifOxyC12_full_50_8]OGK04520.1 MAG: hypothetical protein A2350_17990 [Candidatus Raymondbacteria b